MKYIKVEKEKLEKEKERLQYNVSLYNDTDSGKLIKLSLEQWINCIDWILSISEGECE